MPTLERARKAFQTCCLGSKLGGLMGQLVLTLQGRFQSCTHLVGALRLPLQLIAQLRDRGIQFLLLLLMQTN